MQKNRTKLHLDAHLGDPGQGPVHQEALVQKAGRSLDHVRLEALGQAHRIVGGEHRKPDLLEYAFVAQGAEPVPGIRAKGRHQVAGHLNHDAVGLAQAQPAQAGPGCVLNVVAAAVGAGGFDHDTIGARAGQPLADHGFRVRRAVGGVENGEARSRGQIHDFADFGLRRAPARRNSGVQRKLRGPKAKLGERRVHQTSHRCSCRDRHPAPQTIKEPVSDNRLTDAPRPPTSNRCLIPCPNGRYSVSLTTCGRR